MEYAKFTLLFFVIHTIAYYIAGVINYQFSKKLYGGRDQLYKSFLRNMSDSSEALNVNKKIIPVQLVRAIFMSVVLYPVLGVLGDLSFGLKFLFFGGLMFVYADFCSAIPFSNTLEGLIYMKPEFVKRKVFWTIQMEAVIYSVLFGLAAGWLLV
ncbi:MAG: hypothetical protein EA408_10715 [Marinilabiliales bacterium]|nr:MAG: hypothetical protein EA408_10715 [Marinilabiliales bacterium]